VVSINFYGDYHTHSRYSDGRQSVDAIVEAAVSRGLLEVAITDHGPLAAVIGVKKPESYLAVKEKISRIQSRYPGIRILLGAEANIRDLSGTLDLEEDIIEELDILIVGLHPYTLYKVIRLCSMLRISQMADPIFSSRYFLASWEKLSF
jgi:putative hydrolase